MTVTKIATTCKLASKSARRGGCRPMQLLVSVCLLAGGLLVPHFPLCQIIEAQALSPSDCARGQPLQSRAPLATGTRHQRQFTINNSNNLADSPAALVSTVSPPNPVSSDGQPEEFSLAQSTAPSSQPVRGRSLDQQATGEQEGPKRADSTSSGALTTYTLAEPSSQAAHVLQPPPMPTTSSSILQAVAPPASRRQEELSNSSTTSSSSSPESANGQQEEGPAGRDLRPPSGSQPVSLLPSSVSIITPILGPLSAAHLGQQQASISGAEQAMNASFNMQQQTPNQQPSLIRPIVVLGNPLNEREYSQTAEQHSISQQQAAATSGSDLHHQPQPQFNSVSQKEPKLIDDQQQQRGPSEASQDMSSQADLQRMSGPPLYYSDGHLSLALNQLNNSASASPRLLTSSQASTVMANTPRRPSLPPAVNQANAVSGFRSPMSPSGPLLATAVPQMGASLQGPVNAGGSLLTPASFYQTAPPYTGINLYDAGTAQQLQQLAAAQQQQQQQQSSQQQQSMLVYNKPAYMLAPTNNQMMNSLSSTAQPQMPRPLPSSVNGPPTGAYSGRRPLNITRVEHISAECSNDLIRALIVFNGTFKGIIYSSGYVTDPTCLYVNGTGSTRYEFSIHLNQCGTLGRQQLHAPSIPGEARRRDQVMWNTLSIQYNSIIEQEWDEHFKVSCEYGSDFWKTVSFSPFNVETNTGSPVVFTINPPQCQMDVLLGHGMGPKIAVDGPVTVGDPLTLLIHMKSEKAGYDILVKNCVAHNGGKQRMQLIDSNGCVVNERFISPFRGTYNDNDLRHVTLYAYLKAFRFTGSPVLYLECEIHMCQSACPPQMCYWRRLSKRSVSEFDYEYTANNSLIAGSNSSSLSGLEDQPPPAPVISDSLNLFKALQVRHESENSRSGRSSKQADALNEVYGRDEEASLICYRHAEVSIFLMTILSLLALVVTIAVTCCLRVRKLTRSQFQHNRFAGSSGPASPASLLSISDATSSILTASSVAGQMAAKSSSLLWSQHQQPHQPPAKPQPPNKPASVYLQRQRQLPLSSSFQPRLATYLYLAS